MHRRQFIATGAAGSVLARGSASDPRELSSALAASRTQFAVNVEMWWGKLPWIERVRRAVEFGYPAIEFWPWRRKPVDELLGIMDKTGLEVAQFTAWGFSPGLNDAAHHDRFEAEIKASIETAHRLRCKKMTVVAGNDRDGVSQSAMHDAVVAGLRRVAPLVEAAKVCLILEPMNIRVDHSGHCLYGSPEARRIIREVDSPFVKLNWDLYHMQISEGDLCGRLREGFAEVGYLQLADHPGRGQPGTGEINYARVLKEAWELGYRDYVGLECRPRGGEFKATQDVALAGRF